MLVFTAGFMLGIVLALQWHWLGMLMALTLLVMLQVLRVPAVSFRALARNLPDAVPNCRDPSLALGMTSLALVFLSAMLLAVIDTGWQLHAYRAWQVPTELISRNVNIVGDIITIPNNSPFGESFLVRLRRWQDHPLNAVVKINWSYPHPPLDAGQRWQWTARFKPPHSLHNFGAFNFDYNALLQGIQANGYVGAKSTAQLLGVKQCCWIERTRLQVQQKIIHSIKSPEIAAIIAALTVGSRSTLSSQQWQVFQRTGTSHLIAISGLHVGLIAMFIYLCCYWLVSWFPRLIQKIPAPQWSAVAAIIAAASYSFLAGMSLPTQRALIMIFVVMLGQLLWRDVALWRRLLLAFLLIMLWQPFALFSVSFWLSFLAVAWLMYGLSGRLRADQGWRQALRMQWVIFLGLLPVTLFFFQQLSLVMYVANIIAVPWVAMGIVPLCFVATVAEIFSTTLAQSLFWLSGKLLAPLWIFLQWLAHGSYAVWQYPLYTHWILLTSTIGMLWLLAPRGWPLRYLGIAWLLPLFFYQPASPRYGEVWFTLLDVGQGLASVVQTQQHILVYDTGPSFPQGFDAGARIVVPYLRHRGIKKIDILMISHGDNDHIGGANALLQALRVQQISTSVPQRFAEATIPVQTCHLGQHWEWDGILFSVLSPLIDQEVKGNDRSCVLRIEVPGTRALLLTGDIEKRAEQKLVQYESSVLPATILVAPHHGSKTSSTLEFVQNVHPGWVLLPTGFYNRFHFPAPLVVQRYQQVGAKILNTAHDGAIFVRIDAKGRVILRTVKSSN